MMATSSLWSVTVLMSPVMVETTKGHLHVEAALTLWVGACIFKTSLFISYGDCGDAKPKYVNAFLLHDLLSVY